MKTSNTPQTPLPKSSVPSNGLRRFKQIRRLLMFGACLFGAASVHAASQTWTNAPVDNNWANTNNWVGLAVPGVTNNADPHNLSTDVATFNSAIPVSGIGGAGDPIVNDPVRQVGGLVFDTASCGAYVFGHNLNDNFLDVHHGQSIRVGTAVANPIVFNQAIRVDLPNSTNGRFDITNNATSTAATLFFASITNHSADTRPLSLYLGGSNTGTNTIAHIDDEASTAGAIHLIKEDAGRWILSGSNDLPQITSGGDGIPANVLVDQGTLEVQDPGSLGGLTMPNIVVDNSGVLQIDNVTLNNPGMTLNGGTLRMNGSGTVNGITVGTSTGINTSLATTSSGDVMTVLTNTGGASDSMLHVAGPGTVLLSGPGTYAGSWSFDSGTCQVGDPAALGTGPMASVSAGATLDLSSLGAVTYTWTPASLGASGTGISVGSTAATITADASATIDLASGANSISLTITPTSSSGDTTHPALYISQGTLSLGGNVFTIDNASGSPLGIGTYTLIAQANGTITSAGGFSIAQVTGSGLAANTVGTIQVSGGSLNLVVQNYVAKNLVWKGGSPNNWDTTTANWLNGGSPSVFTASDNVLFNSTGVANSLVNLVGSLAPGSVTVDTSAGNYTFTGSGAIGGATGLTKIGTGTLIVQTPNVYIGDTVISNGTLQLGGNNVLPGASTSGQVVIQEPGVLDMNTYSNTIGSLDGNGTVDCTGGGAVTLTVGNNNSDGTFSGVIRNTSGTLTLTKVGTGAETLSSAGTYTGGTVLDNGILTVANSSALGGGTLTLNLGTLNLASDLVVSSLAGNSGSTIENDSDALAKTLTVSAASGTTYGGSIADGSGGGAVAVKLLGSSITLNGSSTYSGGTVLGAGVSVTIGDAGALGTGTLYMSNNATLNYGAKHYYLTTPVTTAPGATATFAVGGNVGYNGGFSNPFNGDSTSTNIFMGEGSWHASGMLDSFYGTVRLVGDPSANGVRVYNPTVGSTNTTLDMAGGDFFLRDSGDVATFGALTGGLPDTNGFVGEINSPGTFIIGAKGIDTTYSGPLVGALSFVKDGTGTLTLNGGGQTVTNVSSPDGGITFVTNVGYGSNVLFYTGYTTVSNGVLKLAAPAVLTNSTPITIAASSATLDASSMGYISNQVTGGATNQFPVTNGVFEVVSGQTLQGLGTLKGTLLADAGSTFNIGLPTGSFTNSGSVELAGAVTMNVNATNTPNCSQLIASGITVDSTASLVITNIGPEQAATFQLFNHPVSFSSVVLPTLSGTNSWINHLTTDGSITMVAPAPPSPTPPTPVITDISMSGTTLNITATNGAVNGTYFLLESTNLATPLSNWVQVVTGTFDGSGNLNLSTNVVNPAAPQEFYLLSQ